MEKLKAHVCFSPELIGAYGNDNSVVAVIDVFRATSSICTAIHYGAKEVIPVVNVTVARQYLDSGFIVGAERGGEIIEGFEYGNSPFHFMDDKIKGKTIVLSTTNGTNAIAAARIAYKVAIASFLNLDSISSWLLKQEREIVLLCAGWNNKFNMEDTLLAGAIVEKLQDSGKEFEWSDSAIAAVHLYKIAKKDLFGFLIHSSHRRRLARLNIEKDIAYCLTLNQTNVVPVLYAGSIINFNE